MRRPPAGPAASTTGEPITFTLRDVVHKTLGKSAARTVIVTAAGVNVFMALYLRFAISVPSDPSYPFGDEFGQVLRTERRRRRVVGVAQQADHPAHRRQGLGARGLDPVEGARRCADRCDGRCADRCARRGAHRYDH